jgi:hypothetical protein
MHVYKIITAKEVVIPLGSWNQVSTSVRISCFLCRHVWDFDGLFDLSLTDVTFAKVVALTARQGRFHGAGVSKRDWSAFAWAKIPELEQ